MLTKEQKRTAVSAGLEKIKTSHNLIFLDFSGIPTADIRKLKTELKKSGAEFKVVKKRLFNIALKEAGVDYDLLQFKSQLGAVMTPGDLSGVAVPIYKTAKELARAKKDLKVLGAYDMEKKAPVSVEEFMVIAKLPSREILLAMVMGAFTGPLRAFMYLLQEIAKKKQSDQSAQATVPTVEQKQG